jgi:hypothetical protein
MTREDFMEQLQREGFAPRQSKAIVDRLIWKFASQGKSEREAFERIALDLKQGGVIARQLDELKKKLPIEGAPSSLSAAPPEQGHSQQAQAPGPALPLQADRAGKLPAKVKPPDRGKKSPTWSASASKIESGISRVSKPVGSAPRRRGFLSYHKWIGAGVAVLVVLVVFGTFLSSVQKKHYRNALAEFDDQLKMDTKREFESSLDNLKYVIETAATLVGRKGVSEKDTVWAFKEAETRLFQFLDMIDQKEAGNDRVYGLALAEVGRDLGSGMHLVLLSIRNTKAKNALRLGSLFAVDTKNPGLDPNEFLRKGSYDLYDPGLYRPSSRASVVRNGNEIALQLKN